MIAEGNRTCASMIFCNLLKFCHRKASHQSSDQPLLSEKFCVTKFTLPLRLLWLNVFDKLLVIQQYILQLINDSLAWWLKYFYFCIVMVIFPVVLPLRELYGPVLLLNLVWKWHYRTLCMFVKGSQYIALFTNVVTVLWGGRFLLKMPFCTQLAKLNLGWIVRLDLHDVLKQISLFANRAFQRRLKALDWVVTHGRNPSIYELGSVWISFFFFTL